MKKYINAILVCGFVLAMIAVVGCAKVDGSDSSEAVDGVAVESAVENDGSSNEGISEDGNSDSALQPESDANTEQNEDTIVDDLAEEDSVDEPRELGTFILYFSGIDVWGWTDTTSRSDVNIIAAINTNTRHIQLINTPRDYYVELPISNGAKDKLTHAGIYGVDVSMGALEMLYGIDIDYYFRMNFSGFEKIIDTMGGVDVYSEFEFTVEPIKHYEQGYNHLTGLEALAFVRERHAFASGDNQRGRNQMELLKAMVKKVCSIDFLLNYDEIMAELTDMYRTNMTNEFMADLVFNQLLDGTEWTVDSFSVTGSGGMEPTYSVPSASSYVMYPNQDDIATATELINSVLNESND